MSFGPWRGAQQWHSGHPEGRQELAAVPGSDAPREFGSLSGQQRAHREYTAGRRLGFTSVAPLDLLRTRTVGTSWAEQGAEVLLLSWQTNKRSGTSGAAGIGRGTFLAFCLGMCSPDANYTGQVLHSSTN
ncbi:hypothetical protein AAFF_G00166290 [Aldrovandia affinis]|uniref:Uncharacterized protein n=1 Tax=Aldrovandia affinis TaxID=143900 RepID=A0AAD7W8I7_9TELE|nr:hypothetical protein AAFF_G00166290 [Aldrovandia affinis]